MGDESNCCICLAEVSEQDSARPNTCNHRFHQSCLLRWAEQTNTCCLCKTRFRSIISKDADGRRKTTPVMECNQRIEVNYSFSEDAHIHNPCDVCGATNATDLLTCIICNDAYHAYCLTPPLDSCPDTWACSICADEQADQIDYHHPAIPSPPDSVCSDFELRLPSPAYIMSPRRMSPRRMSPGYASPRHMFLPPHMSSPQHMPASPPSPRRISVRDRLRREIRERDSPRPTNEHILSPLYVSPSPVRRRNLSRHEGQNSPVRMSSLSGLRAGGQLDLSREEQKRPAPSVSSGQRQPRGIGLFGSVDARSAFCREFNDRAQIPNPQNAPECEEKRPAPVPGSRPESLPPPPLGLCIFGSSGARAADTNGFPERGTVSSNAPLGNALPTSISGLTARQNHEQNHDTGPNNPFAMFSDSPRWHPDATLDLASVFRKWGLSNDSHIRISQDPQNGSFAHSPRPPAPVVIPGPTSQNSMCITFACEHYPWTCRVCRTANKTCRELCAFCSSAVIEQVPHLIEAKNTRYYRLVDFTVTDQNQMARGLNLG